MPIDKDINAGYMGSPGMGFSSSDRFDNYMDRGLLSLPSQINSMINTIDLLIQILNSSYTPEQLRSEEEAMAWFLS